MQTVRAKNEYKGETVLTMTNENIYAISRMPESMSDETFRGTKKKKGHTQYKRSCAGCVYEPTHAQERDPKAPVCNSEKECTNCDQWKMQKTKSAQAQQKSRVHG